MIIYFEGMQLNIKQIRRENINSETPQWAFLKGNHFGDVKRESACLKTLLLKIIPLPVKRAYDLMAGCGFSGLLMRKYLDVPIIVNDLDKGCCSILSTNFKDVFNLDVFDVTFDFSDSIVFVDFNNFTLKKYTFWKPLLDKIIRNCNHLIITDSANFGFRFGEKNLLAYGVKSKEGYYEKLSEVVGNNTLFLKYVVPFNNAAICYFSNSNIGIGKITFLKATPIEFIEGKKDGLLYNDNISHTRRKICS